MSSPASQHEAVRFRTAILRQVGLQFDDTKLPFLEEVLAKRISALHTSSAVYLWALENEPAHDEIRALGERLTVNETYFFRNSEQFDALARVVLPDLMQARMSTRQLRFLSAGCASGEEPYSIAILSQEVVPQPLWDVSIHGIDLNHAVLEKARRGQFSAWSLRETPPDVQQRWFDAAGRDFVLKERIKSAVRFDHGNLVSEDPELWPPNTYDVVFCRNVVMYFSSSHAAAVIRRIARSLAPGGYLFLGHAETLRGLSDDFCLCNTHGTFYYQRKFDLAPPVSATSTPASLRSSGQPHVAVAPSEEWVDAIREASERVAALADSAQGAGAPSTVSSTPSWSVAPILAAIAREDFAHARTGLAELPREADEDPDALLVKATLHIHTSDPVSAGETCRKLLELDGMNAGAHFVLGLCCEKAEDRSGAAQRYKTAIYFDPNFAMPHLRLGLIARASGNRGEARRELSQALVLLGGEDASRLLLFGGGFNRKSLIGLCEGALRDNAVQL